MMTDLLICFSHLRWNFVYQRPQHLMTRAARQFQVYFIEEPIYDATEAYNEINEGVAPGITTVIPHLPAGSDSPANKKELLDSLMSSFEDKKYILWYYTPMALEFSDHLQPEAIIYDCMDELSGFKFAPPLLKELEKQLMQKADLVFTGGYHLYEAKKNMHPNIHPFPSSIDKEHFEQARREQEDPEDQASVPHPRIGYYGVVDERFDIPLLTALAATHTDWHFMIVGPVVKIDPSLLPRYPNIHYTGQKGYKELPCYLSGWDVAMMPFLLNEATQFISPTKTPEYLSGGKPVVSTPIRDVVKPYGTLGLVKIASTHTEFEKAIQLSLDMKDRASWLEKVDAFLLNNSWENTWNQMMKLITKTSKSKKPNKSKAYV
jgi:glycosyltransferase involved in cell wall biosynthesis